MTNSATAIAYLEGKPYEQLPLDLYIPPEPLRVSLQEFSGPLDLLLYLIRRDKLAIELINIAQIANQYLAYIKLMKQFNLSLAAEYLIQAAVLAELKSRALLPRTKEEEQVLEETSVRLLQKLKEYEKLRGQAEYLEQLPRLERDFFIPFVRVGRPATPAPRRVPSVNELADYYKRVLLHHKVRKSYQVKLEELSTRERMSGILDKLGLALKIGTKLVPFEQLFSTEEGKDGVVVSLVALTQLVKENLAEYTQASSYGRIYVSNSRRPAA